MVVREYAFVVQAGETARVARGKAVKPVAVLSLARAAAEDVIAHRDTRDRGVLHTRAVALDELRVDVGAIALGVHAAFFRTRQLDGGVADGDDRHVSLLLVLGIRAGQRHADLQAEEVHVERLALGEHLEVEDLAHAGEPLAYVDDAQVLELIRVE